MLTRSQAKRKRTDQETVDSSFTKKSKSEDDEDKPKTSTDDDKIDERKTAEDSDSDEDKPKTSREDDLSDFIVDSEDDDEQECDSSMVFMPLRSELDIFTDALGSVCREKTTFWKRVQD